MKFQSVALAVAFLVLAGPVNAQQEDWRKELDEIVAQMEGPIYAQAELNQIMVRWTAFLNQHGRKLGRDQLEAITDKLEENPSVTYKGAGGYVYVRHEPDEASGVLPVQVIGKRNDPELVDHVKRIKATIASDKHFKITEVTEKRRLVLTLNLKEEGTLKLLHADLTINPGGKEHGIGLSGSSAALMNQDQATQQRAYSRLFEDCFVSEKLPEKFGQLGSLSDGADFNGLAFGVYAADRRSGKPKPKQTALGIGILLGSTEYPTVISVGDGSPAKEAGIAPTGVLVAIQGRSVKGYTAQEATDFIARQPDTFKITYADSVKNVKAARTLELTKRIVEYIPK